MPYVQPIVDLSHSLHLERSDLQIDDGHPMSDIYDESTDCVGSHVQADVTSNVDFHFESHSFEKGNVDDIDVQNEDSTDSSDFVVPTSTSDVAAIHVCYFNFSKLKFYQFNMRIYTKC